MLISVVADVHGNWEALARVADRAQRLVILGDLLDYVDYHVPTSGIMGEMFGVDAVLEFTRLRSVGAFGQLRRFNAGLWESLSDPVGELAGMVQERYRRVVASVPTDTVVILGNVDVPDEWDAVVGDIIPRRDGQVVSIDGVRFGLVAGGVRRFAAPSSPMLAARVTQPERHPWRPFIRSSDEYRRVVDSVGSVDVLGSHVPPDIAELRYDVVPARLEMAGPGLTEHIDRHQPTLALFGHVHQPLAPRKRRGMTECRHVGHFQRTGTPLIIDSDQVLAARAVASRG